MRFSWIICLITLPLMSSYCLSPIYCKGKLLHAIQTSGIFLDSKTFVDMPTSKPEDQVLVAFSRLPANATAEDYHQFISDNFLPPGSDLVQVEPVDWKPNPKFIENIQDSQLKQLALVLHSKWKSLLRKFDFSSSCDKCASTSFRLEQPFIIPGGRFRESYYWDTFWIVKGLIKSEMYETIRGMLRNFLEMVKLYGFVPNGSRIYYLNRSQPPLLSQMVFYYYSATKDFNLLLEALPYLDKEYSFWMSHRVAHLKLPNGVIHVLNKYDARSEFPRPESYKEDFAAAQHLHTEADKSAFYSQIIASTESGWDFSSRWLKERSKLETTMTKEIIPSDLNAYLYKTEKILSFFHGLANNTSMQIVYEEASIKRRNAMHLFLWDQQALTFKDYNITSGLFSERNYLISNLIPLFYEMIPNNVNVTDALESFRDLLFERIGGIPASLDGSGEQWDYPNVWAPYHLDAVQFFMKINETLALNIAQRLVNTVYCGFNRTGHIFEKYHAEKIGFPGGGGEYIVQEGFGWTNGVAISLLSLFGDKLLAPTCPIFEVLSESYQSDSWGYTEYFLFWSVLIVAAVVMKQIPFRNIRLNLKFNKVPTN